MKTRSLPIMILAVIIVGNGISPGHSATAAPRTAMTTRVSVASDGTQGNGNSGYLSISAGGRYVAFDSLASNLVPGDTNGYSDTFVHDQQTGQTTRVSVASDGMEANGETVWPSISADGRYVAFESIASNLVSDDTNSTFDVFVHDRQTGETTRVSVASDSTQANYESRAPSISTDGRYVAFQSDASNLVPGDTNGWFDVFVHDRQTGETTRVSRASDGTQGNWSSFWPSISADGRYVAFRSFASNLVSGDTNDVPDVFVHDRWTGETTRVSVASDGTQGNNSSSWNAPPSISADGRYVAFTSFSTNLVPGDTNGFEDVFIHDQQTGQTVRVSVASDGTQGNAESGWPCISGDGRYVTFWSVASNLIPSDTNGTTDVFVHDRQTGQTSRVSVSSNGVEGNGPSGLAVISADGNYVAFASYASNLVSGDTNGVIDLFAYNQGGGQCTNPVTALKQYTLPWGEHPYADIGEKIKDKGCLLTSWTMLINYLGSSKGFSTDPATLNDWLLNHNGYLGGLVNNDAVAQYARDNGINLEFRGWLARNGNDTTLDSYLCAGKPAILEEPGHFVLATGQATDGGVNTYAINDPAWDRISLKDYGYTYQHIALYNTTLGDLKRLVVSAHSPVEMLVTDPSGRRTGYDQSTGTILNEIPSSTYFSQSIVDDAVPINPATEGKLFWASGVADGIYKVDIIGTGSGSYTLHMLGYNQTGTSNSRTTNGQTSVGQVHTIGVQYSSTNGLVSLLYLPFVAK